MFLLVIRYYKVFLDVYIYNNDGDNFLILVVHHRCIRQINIHVQIWLCQDNVLRKQTITITIVHVNSN